MKNKLNSENTQSTKLSFGNSCFLVSFHLTYRSTALVLIKHWFNQSVYPTWQACVYTWNVLESSKYSTQSLGVLPYWKQNKKQYIIHVTKTISFIELPKLPRKEMWLALSLIYMYVNLILMFKRKRFSPDREILKFPIKLSQKI